MHEHTGFRFFLISVSSEPPLRAMISGAASGSWAMGEPHSPQNQRHTALPDEPVPFHFLIGPSTVSLSLGTTATRAVLGLLVVVVREYLVGGVVECDVCGGEGWECGGGVENQWWLLQRGGHAQ